MKNDSATKLVTQQVQSYQQSTVLKLRIGALMIFGGFVLLILGISGSVEIVIDAADIKGKLINASPGIVFAFFGYLIIARTHHRASQNLQYDEKGTLRDAGTFVAHGMQGDASKYIFSDKRQPVNVQSDKTAKSDN